MNGTMILWAALLCGQVSTPPSGDRLPSAASAAPTSVTQSPNGTVSPSPSSIKVTSIWDFAVKGGPVMIPIGLCSLAALTVIVERLVSLRRKNVIPPLFLPGLRGVLGQEVRNPGAALEYCKASVSPIANIFAAGIKRLGAPVETMEKYIQEAGEREITRLRKYLRLLSLITAIAPLLGLLGTIFGMITAFQTVATSAEALGKTELLAKGIYEAMITTAAGLMVAIPTLASYHGFAAKIDRLVGDMDFMTVEFVESYAASPTVDPPVMRRAAVPGTVHLASEATDGKVAAVSTLAASA